MKLKEYAAIISRFAEEYPEVDVVYAKDEEGNSFRLVTFTPDVGFYKDNEFISDDESKGFKINAICIN